MVNHGGATNDDVVVKMVPVLVVNDRLKRQFHVQARCPRIQHCLSRRGGRLPKTVQKYSRSGWVRGSDGQS